MVAIPHNTSDIPGTPAAIPGASSATVPSYGDVRAPTSVRLRDMNGRYVKNGFGFEWQNLQQLMNLPEEFGKELLDELEKHFTALAEEIQVYAQENAPWQDQTGDARRGLKAIPIRRGEIFEIDLGHTVDYGFYLENHNGGALAIIQPTLAEFAPKMADIGDSASKGTFDGQLEGGFE